MLEPFRKLFLNQCCYAVSKLVEHLNFFENDPLHTSLPCIYLHFLVPTTTPSSCDVDDFYDLAMTHGVNMTEVTCCTLDQRSLTASCGGGLSCSAVCHAMDASPCPSGRCDDCEALSGNEDRSCTATDPSMSCNNCVFDGCLVKDNPGTPG